MMKGLIRKLVVGNRNYFGSWTEYKQVMLSGQFGTISILAFLFFIIVDFFRQDYVPIVVFAIGIMLVMLSMYYHRKGWHCTANTILYSSLLVLIYLFVSSESPSNGGIIFFIPITLAAFASFDYKHRKIAIMLALLSAFLFLAAVYTNFRILPWREYSDEGMLFNMLFYFVVAMPSSMLTIYIMMKLNHRSARQLIESNKLLRKSNQELDRFIYSTSHDLRAPLASLLGLIDLASRTGHIDDIRKYLGLMKGRVHALDHFIKDITDYSRNSRTEIINSSFDLHKLVDEIWDSLKYTPSAESITLQMDFKQEYFISTDYARLKIILSNLIANAIRYHDNSKDDKYIRISCKPTENSFIVSVQDNGQGIDPQYHSKIFQMFFRANETSTGSGLGLYIVQEALDKLSGRVRLDSALNVGSTFTLKIPKVSI